MFISEGRGAWGPKMYIYHPHVSTGWTPPSKACSGCENNTGGGCLYDIQMEADADNVPIEEYLSEEHCSFAEYEMPDDYYD